MFAAPKISPRAALMPSLRVIVLVIAGLAASPSWAQDAVAESSELLRAGQASEALQRLDDHLAQQPRDAQARFLRGVILSQQQRVEEAIQAFTEFTQDYPELPEPYNNLAVLHAGKGDYDKARVALEMAVRTNPAYAVAHENLGDVYAQLAARSYARSLELNADSRTAGPKLRLIGELFSGTTPPTVAQAAPPAPARATPTPPTATSAPAAAATATAPAVTIEPPQTDAPEVVAAVMAWADAWSRQDVPAYLSAYSADFEVPNRRSRAAWERDRHRLISNKTRIALSLSDMNVERAGDHAVVQFTQAYESPQYQSVTRKTLRLVRDAQRWVIQQEISDS